MPESTTPAAPPIETEVTLLRQWALDALDEDLAGRVRARARGNRAHLFLELHEARRLGGWSIVLPFSRGVDRESVSALVRSVVALYYWRCAQVRESDKTLRSKAVSRVA
jgi:hypothetical protein